MQPPDTFKSSIGSGEGAKFVDAIADAQTDEAVEQEISSEGKEPRYHLGPYRLGSSRAANEDGQRLKTTEVATLS